MALQTTLTSHVMACCSITMASATLEGSGPGVKPAGS